MKSKKQIFLESKGFKIEVRKKGWYPCKVKRPDGGLMHFLSVTNAYDVITRWYL